MKIADFALRLPRISADAHASLLAVMSKWKGAHILSVEQFDEPMLLELFGVAARLKRMVAASGKCDVLRGDDSLAPLEETCVWVEMTLLQKKIYKAVLESRRDVLVAGVDSAPLPSTSKTANAARKEASRRAGSSMLDIAMASC